MSYAADEKTVNALVEIANMSHHKLKFFPLQLKNIKSHCDDMESKDKFGMLGKLHNITISGIFSNGEKRQSVAISFLVSSIDIEEDVEMTV